MTLRRFIEEALDPRIFRPVPLPKRTRIGEVAEKIAKRSDAVATLTSFDAGLLLEKLGVVARTGSWGDLSEREFRYVPGCLWAGEPPLAGNVGFLNRYFAALRGRRSRLATKALVWSYL